MKKTSTLLPGLSWTGIRDRDLKVFDIIMETEFGTTYNSYVLQGSEKTALIETAKMTFFDDYQRQLESLIPLESIDYLIVDHTEPDHAGSIAKLLDRCPNLTIVGTPAALQFLREIVNREFTALPVKNQQTLSLGDKTLQFYSLPNLHWPDTMYTWCPEDRVLFTCDSFGAHYSFDGLRLSEVEDQPGYQRALKYYYDHILGPFSSFMRKGLETAQSLDPVMICPGHGPVLDGQLKELFSLYSQWTQPAPVDAGRVIIAYVSAYGYTRQLAEAIKAGVDSVSGSHGELMDLTEVKRETAAEQIRLSGGLLLGSPTILSEALPPVWDVLSILNPVQHGGRSAAVFGSYGWSGEAAAHLNERLKQLRMTVLPELKIRFQPSSEQLKAAEQWGRDFAGQLKKA